MDIRDQKLAQLITRYSVDVQPGDKVVIRGGVAGEPLIKELYKQVLEAGGHPFLWLEFPWEAELLLGRGSEEQYTYIHKPVEQFYAHYEPPDSRCRRRQHQRISTASIPMFTPASRSRAVH